MTKPGTPTGVSNSGVKSLGKPDEKRRAQGSWIPAKKSKKSNEIKGVIDFIQDTPQASPLKNVIQKVENRHKLMAALYEALEFAKLGKFADQLEPGNIDESKTLVLQVQHGAIAAKLQQRLPTVLRYLADNGWNIQSLRIKVLPTTTVPVNDSKLKGGDTKRVLSETGKQSLENLAKALPQESATRLAVQNLIAKIKKSN